MRKLGIVDWTVLVDAAATIKLNEKEWDMLRKGEKWVLFLDEDQSQNAESGQLLLVDENTDEVLAYARAYSCTELAYDKELYEPVHEGYYAFGRNEALKTIYFEWCKRKDVRPNPNNGWLKSKEFIAYTEKIGWGKNYVLFLSDLTTK